MDGEKMFDATIVNKIHNTQRSLSKLQTKEVNLPKWLGGRLCLAEDAVDIVGIETVSPAVITTSSAHGLTNGDRVRIENIGGNTQYNGYWTVNVLTTTTFELLGSRATEPEYNTTNFIRFDNVSFEDGTLGSTPNQWLNVRCTLTKSVEKEPLYGYYCGKVVSGTDTIDYIYQTGTTTGFSPATDYTISVWLKKTADGSTKNVRLAINWRDGADAGLGISTSGYLASTDAVDDWTRVEFTATSPAGTVGVRPFLYVNQGTVWFDGLQIEQSTSATPFVYGTVKKINPITTNDIENRNEIYLAPYSSDPSALTERCLPLINTQYAAIISGETTITDIDTTQLCTGMVVSGAGIPNGTTIQSIDSDTEITLDDTITSDEDSIYEFAIPEGSVFDVFANNNKLVPFLWGDPNDRLNHNITNYSGVYVKFQDAFYWYLGTCRTLDEVTEGEELIGNGFISDTITRRFIWNMYNRIDRKVRWSDSTTHTLTGSVTQFWRNLNQIQLEFVTGLPQNIHVSLFGKIYNDTPNFTNLHAILWITTNGTTSFNQTLPWMQNYAYPIATSSTDVKDFPKGYTYMNLVERAEGAGSVSTFEWAKILFLFSS